MKDLIVSIVAFVMLIAAAWFMLSGLFGGWRGPNFLAPYQQREERRRRRGTALVETAVLLALYPMLLTKVGLEPRTALVALGALSVGLFCVPGLARTAIGVMGGVLTFLSVPWASIDYGLVALLMITGYLVLASQFAPDR